MPAVAYVAHQVEVPAEEWAAYDWRGRAITRHRTEIRTAFGFGQVPKGSRSGWRSGLPRGRARGSSLASGRARGSRPW
ncbi:DUF4158 domain-containing protein [Streptomyces sp. A5-4]|uniref:DUF4158 domain-containing protein n=1 Tax=Streptomyces sp. A5-4 TaxID=3384771 RepID=UPI003DA9D825